MYEYEYHLRKTGSNIRALRWTLLRTLYRSESRHELAEFSEKADQYDQEQMTAADLSYYLDVTNRINQKLLSVAA